MNPESILASSVLARRVTLDPCDPDDYSPVIGAPDVEEVSHLGLTPGPLPGLARDRADVLWEIALDSPNIYLVRYSDVRPFVEAPATSMVVIPYREGFPSEPTDSITLLPGQRLRLISSGSPEAWSIVVRA